MHLDTASVCQLTLYTVLKAPRPSISSYCKGKEVSTFRRGPHAKGARPLRSCTCRSPDSPVCSDGLRPG